MINIDELLSKNIRVNGHGSKESAKLDKSISKSEK